MKKPELLEFELSQEQAKRFSELVGAMLGKLSKIKIRMEKRGMWAGKLYPLVCEAQDAMHKLSVFAHYEAMGGGDRPIRYYEGGQS